MPTSEAPAKVNESTVPVEVSPDTDRREEESSASDGGPAEERRGGRRAASTSRWVDYDSHELLQVISDLEDERRWSRLRESIWLALLIHIALISAITWIPMYVLKVPKVVSPFDVLKDRQNLTYLNLPPDVLRRQNRIVRRPVEKPPDSKALEELNRAAPPMAAPPPKAEPAPASPAPAPETPAQPITPQPQSQSPVEAPKPSAVPARPNFALESKNPADQLRQDMQNAMRNRGQGTYNSPGANGLPMHPGAGTGGLRILSDTQGVDFSSWLARWHYETERTWDPLIPDEVNPPILKSGVVAIRFKVLPSGRLMPGSVQLVGRSGDVALDRAAWGALVGSNYPPLPRAFHGPYLELEAYFLYNMQPPQ
jgi:hypothetical protein